MCSKDILYNIPRQNLMVFFLNIRPHNLFVNAAIQNNSNLFFNFKNPHKIKN